MKIEYKQVKDICGFVGGSQPPKSSFIYEPREGYVRLIQTRDYKSNDFPTYIPIDSTKKFCDKNDIMIGRYGPPVFQILRGLEGAYNVALMKAVPKKEIDRDFLYYFLKQDSVFKYVDKLSARTGGQTGVDLVSLNQYPVRIPEKIENQKLLVASLKVVDKKIELNNQINAELEAMAKTLYDYWFVQFDFPNTEGKPYKSSGGKMVYNEALKREIPEGWAVSILDNIISIYDSKRVPLSSKQRAKMQGNIPYYGATSVMDYVSDYIFDGEYVLLAEDGSVMDENGFPILQFIEGKAWVNNHAHVLKGANGFSNPMLHQTLKNIPVINIMSGSIQKKINQNNLKNTPIFIPPQELLNLINPVLVSIYTKILLAEKESIKLESLRDWLLPMLMNGQVTVK